MTPTPGYQPPTLPNRLVATFHPSPPFAPPVVCTPKNRPHGRAVGNCCRVATSLDVRKLVLRRALNRAFDRASV